jgi:hypothetical protein
MKILINLLGLLTSILVMPLILMVFVISIFVFTIEEVIKNVKEQE